MWAISRGHFPVLAAAMKGTCTTYDGKERMMLSLLLLLECWANPDAACIERGLDIAGHTWPVFHLP